MSDNWLLLMQDSSVPEGEAVFSLAFSDANHGWMLTLSGLLETENSGQSWRNR
jgi:photosystem II stability/assembly factor-like uncharacterized protein